jgi:phosphoenolpyruvate carboxykinase (ATP)
MNFSQELTPEQAVLAYLWGESTHSYASQPLKAGESVRIVGTDPFIVGSRAKKINRFYEIIMTLVNNYPGKLKFMQYNTGGIGEIIETTEENGQKKKRLIRKVNRVPINLMANIQRGDLRGTNLYEKGRLGTREIVRCDGVPLDEWDIQRFYSEDQIQGYIKDLVDGRKNYSEEIAAEGLRQEILYAAERSFQIDKSGKRAQIAVPGEEKQDQGEQDRPAFVTSLKTRPRRERFWRGR